MENHAQGDIIFSEEMLRKVFDSLSAHIAIIDKDGFILETNAAWKRLNPRAVR